MEIVAPMTNGLGDSAKTAVRRGLIELTSGRSKSRPDCYAISKSYNVQTRSVRIGDLYAMAERKTPFVHNIFAHESPRAPHGNQLSDFKVSELGTFRITHIDVFMQMKIVARHGEIIRRELTYLLVSS
jgi:hypothetical protein